MDKKNQFKSSLMVSEKKKKRGCKPAIAWGKLRPGLIKKGRKKLRGRWGSMEDDGHAILLNNDYKQRKTLS